MGKHGNMPKRRVYFDMNTDTKPHGGRKQPMLDEDADIREQLEWWEEEKEGERENVSNR